MSNELWCNLNGQIQSCAQTPFSSAADAFRLRYGVYETYLCKKGKPEYAPLHWERLKKGMTALGFRMPEHFSAHFFTRHIEELLVKSKLHSLSRTRIQVFTEDSTAPYTAQFLIESFPVAPSVTEWLEDGIKVGLLPAFQKEISLVSSCKISHNLHFLPARSLMQERGLDDVLLCNTGGRIAESAMANLFWIKDGLVCTPPLSEGCLAGTIRAVLIDCLQKNNVRVEERPCPLPELQDADEVFLCNSIRKIRWVREMEGRQYKAEMSRMFYELLMGTGSWQIRIY